MDDFDNDGFHLSLLFRRASGDVNRDGQLDGRELSMPYFCIWHHGGAESYGIKPPSGLETRPAKQTEVVLTITEIVGNDGIGTASDADNCGLQVKRSTFVAIPTPNSVQA